MELNDFIAKTLGQIVQGVQQAQNANSQTGAIINPQVASRHGANQEVLKANNQLWDSSDYSLIERVRFDVAVTAEEQTKTEGSFNAGIQVLGIGGKAGLDTNSLSSTVSRIQFAVTVKYPPSHQKKIVSAEGHSGRLQRARVDEDVDDDPLLNVR